MSLYALIGLSLAMFILAASPGPGVFTTMAHSMATGFRSALAVIAGIVLGDIIFLLLAIFGLSMVAQTFGKFFMVVKLCGGLYLIWLGVKIWTAGSGERNPRLNGTAQVRKGFLSGLTITLSNPKVILFYCGFLPTFMDLASLTAMDIIGVTALISTILATVLTSYAFLAAKARQVFSRSAAVRRINRTAAGIMMATGISMLALAKDSG